MRSSDEDAKDAKEGSANKKRTSDENAEEGLATKKQKNTQTDISGPLD